MNEPATYRAMYAAIKENYCEIMTVTDVAEFVGRSRKWVRDNLHIYGDKGTTASELAMILSKRGNKR